MTYPILIADSGSTKTDWLLLTEAGETVRCSTSGINPFMMSEAEIFNLLRTDLVPRLPHFPACVHFYGAGCRDEAAQAVSRALQAAFTLSPTVCHVASDLLGAAHALCGTEPGIACILGTGSNSCLYDGAVILGNVSPLGYVLGDEGSGAVLGRRLLGDFFKGQLPADVAARFAEEYPDLTVSEAIRRVYREPFPNRFLASFAPFLGRHREHPALQQLIRNEFARFFQRNVAQYARPDLPVHFTGSIAFFLQAELRAVASGLGYRVGQVLRSPIEGLQHYHSA
ncbi:MAG: ATPase [Alloprevotella sp.]|nr:ATPase [Alloprevotella sp.]